MKNLILKISNWALANWLALVIFMTVFWMFLLVLVVISWLYGYWSNGMYGTKYELQSCWSGVAAILTGFASIAALAKAAWTKYGQDSTLNTIQGVAPQWGLQKRSEQ